MTLTEGQMKCVKTLDRPLVVAAGAGSGKTFTLTKRIVNALQGGYLSDIDEVCAITFTKKAAGELKSRIKSELRACGLIDQALKVDEAWISTIHGMCARILRAHAIELGIDPAFSVAEGAAVQRYLDQAVDEVLAEARMGASSQRVEELFGEYPARSFGGFGASIEGMLAELLEAASSQASGIDAFVMPGITVEPHIAVESAVEAVEGILALASEEKEGVKRDEWMSATEGQVELARHALERGLTGSAEALRLIASFKLAKTFGGKAFKAQVDEARGTLGSCVMEVRLGAAQGHLEVLVDLARRALEVFAGLKRADGVLDNNDLLVLAARALEEHPSIAARYAHKFKLVMVDEFQDTDQMQVDMIKRLSGEGACRLCTVGDAQQSIYRFRGADVSVYRRHLESTRERWDDAVIELSKNFRSHADVLSFVDRVFEQPAMFGGEFMSLSAGRDEEAVVNPFDRAGSRIVVQHTSTPWRGVEGRDACEFAAHRIAREFASLRDAGHPASEMVLLLGRMTKAGVYARALRDEGLPCVISGGSVFAKTPEAGIVRDLVRVIANPLETQPLFNVLTSPLFALSAGDLLEVGELSDFWRVASGSGEDVHGARSPQLACSLRVMGSACALAGEQSVSHIVERVVADSGWLSRLELSGAEGLASAGNVYKAIRMIRAVEREGACGPVSVMRGFEEALDSSKEAPGALSVSGGNSVRIMTIHASKGLEFPIVAVAEVKEDKAPAAKLLSAAVGGKVYLSLDLGRTAEEADHVDLDAVRDYVLGEVGGEDELAAAVAEDAGALHRRLALREFIARGDAEEGKRLLYVAITRAREALVISSLGKRTKENSLGIPKSALSGVFSALGADRGLLGEGVSQVEFGGSSSAMVECVALEADDGSASDCVPSAPDSREAFAVPAEEDVAIVLPEPYQPLRQGVFSYSSIAEMARGDGALARLSETYTVSVDEGESELVGEESVQGRHDGAVDLDGAWSFERLRPFVEDRATDLGTAFHRLAQYAVMMRDCIGSLASPPHERIDALSRTCGLDAVQRERLVTALDRWFGSDIAHKAGSLPHLDAEVPFFVSVGDAYLEGEIDLLGFDEGRRCAYVVDYKTGGSGDEPAADLGKKHVLQAACYAYAVLLQGFDSVETAFVRVEHGCAGDDTQPQCIRYRFAQDDLSELRRFIAAACQRSASCAIKCSTP